MSFRQIILNLMISLEIKTVPSFLYSSSSQTFWFQDPFILLKISEDPMVLLFYVDYINI